MSNAAAAWTCQRCGTRNVAYSSLCARCGRPRGARALSDGAPRLSSEAEVGSPGFAAVLSGVLPGLGQIYGDRWIKGLLMLLVPLFVVSLVGAFVAFADPLTSLAFRNATLVTFVVVGAMLVFHLYVVADAFAGRLGVLRGRNFIDYVVLGLVALGLIAGYATVYQQAAPWAALAARIFAPISAPATTSGSTQAPAVWTGSERLNVLVLGIDTREGESNVRNTDTMIVLSIDPTNKTAAMLSIPRDVYIDRPGVFQGKINAAYAVGGPQLARRVVDEFLGIRTHAYALINFEAFTKIVDGVGGVIVDAKRPVRDEYYPTFGYGVERLSILPGPQLMNGEVALKYARSRHDTNDYSRARRQQDVIAALRTRIAQPEALRSLPALMDTVGTSVETDFDPANVLPLTRSGTGIASADIRSEVLYPCGADFPHCELTATSQNGFYLIPNLARVRDLAAQLFYDPKIRYEAARVDVMNAGARPGTARDVADRLALRAYGIAEVGDAPAARSAVVLRTPAKRYTAEQLAQALGGIPVETANAGSGPDITVRLGSDFRGFATDLAR